MDPTKTTLAEPIHPDSVPEVPWPTSGIRVSVPDPSTVTGPEPASPAATNPLDRAAQAGHDTIDRLADRSATKVRQLGERMHGAEDALHAKTAQLRETRDELAESLRGTVRSNPLASLAAAVMLGVLIPRITR